MANPVEVIFTMDADTYANAALATTNFGAVDNQVGNEDVSFSNHVYRSFLACDISSIPEGSTITVCTLFVYIIIVGGIGDIEDNLMIQGVLPDSGIYFEELNATWIKRQSIADWATPGGDVATPPAELNYGSFPGGTGPESFTGLMAFAQEALDNRAGNLVVRLKRQGELALSQRHFEFHHRAYSIENRRPRFHITYIPPTGRKLVSYGRAVGYGRAFKTTGQFVRYSMSRTPDEPLIVRVA